MLIAEDFDDRSGASRPGPDSFGFVYFNDGTRVGYSPGMPDEPPVWEPRTNGNGEHRPVTLRHYRLALQVLREKGVITDDMMAAFRAVAG